LIANNDKNPGMLTHSGIFMQIVGAIHESPIVLGHCEPVTDVASVAIPWKMREASGG